MTSREIVAKGMRGKCAFHVFDIFLAHSKEALKRARRYDVMRPVATRKAGASAIKGGIKSDRVTH